MAECAVKKPDVLPGTLPVGTRMTYGSYALSELKLGKNFNEEDVYWGEFSTCPNEHKYTVADNVEWSTVKSSTEGSHQKSVTNPSHYQKHPSGLQCIQITEHMPSNVAAVYKYFWRAGMKENAPSIDDASKAVWYANRQLMLMGGESMLKDGLQGPEVLGKEKDEG